MCERPCVCMDRLDRPAPRRPRPVGRLLAVTWLAAGALLLSQVHLPDLAPVRPPARGQAEAACWGVWVASGLASSPAFGRDLRRLRRAGLPATVRPGQGAGTRVLVVPARSQAAAHAARARAIRLGFPRSSVRRMPSVICRR